MSKTKGAFTSGKKFGTRRKKETSITIPYYRASSKLDDRASAGMTESMKQSLRAAAIRLTEIEGEKVSMAAVIRRLLAAGGLK